MFSVIFFIVQLQMLDDYIKMGIFPQALLSRTTGLTTARYDNLDIENGDIDQELQNVHLENGDS